MNDGKVLLTGGNGLVGRTLTPMLSGKFDVTHFDVSDPADGRPFIQGDLRNAKQVGEACAGMDAVVHVAALHGEAWQQAGDDTGFEVNVLGVKHILEGAMACGVKRVVFTSSIWATGHGSPPPAYLPIDENLPRQPAELYGLTKRLGEQMCAYATEKSSLSTIALRPGGIRPPDAYAPDDPAYLTGCVDVRDAARAHVLALEAPNAMAHEVFVITADSPLSQVDADAFRAEPAKTIDRVVSGAAKRIADGRLKIGPNAEWYTVEKGKKLLGYHPRFNFDPPRV